MEIEIISRRENPLLERMEVRFKIVHEKSGTPKRDEVRAKLAEMLSVNKEMLVIDHLEPRFGVNETLGYAKVYKSKEALEVERAPVLIRNKLKEKPQQKAKQG